MGMLAANAGALSTDRDQPIHIEADWAEADDVRRTTVYKGAVVITQGSLRITGDTSTMYYNDDQELTKMVTVGRPARFRQMPDGDTQYKRAKAKRMEFYADQDLIILLGDAHSWQGEKRLSGERIEFDTRASRVKAYSTPAKGTKKAGAGGKSRVRIVVPPKKACPGSDRKSRDCPPLPSKP